MKPARTRFAVSPTGYMHVGGVRTALFAWLVAKQTGGQFILRIEDTDQAREVTGAQQHIIDTLHWLGLRWQEGPDIGGDYGPYIQSQRLAIYKEWGQKLVDSGQAYADPYSTQELQALRQKAQDEKRPFLYRDHRPANPPVWDGTQPLRLKSQPKTYAWHDEVLGDLSAGPEAVDDFVLIKSDGYATYNFCHIIDDHLMHVTHIIRSQEFIASTPKYLDLYQALGFEPPILATPPYIMAPDGKRKLSKRDNAKDILDYARDGYLPEALLNFLASMGWNDGTEQEIYTVSELIEKFSLKRVQRSGARFDEQRLVWLNGAHIRKLTPDELFQQVQDFWPASASKASDDYKKQILPLVHERLKFFAELPQLTEFFFSEPAITEDLFANNKQLKKLSPAERLAMLRAASNALQPSDFTEADLEQRLRNLVDQLQTKPGILFGLLRAAITGSNVAPGLFETMRVLGKETVLRRLSTALEPTA